MHLLFVIIKLKMIVSKRTHEAYSGNCISFPNLQVLDFTIIGLPCIRLSIYNFLGF